MKHRKFHLHVRNNFFIVKVTKHWNKLSREAVESPSPEIFTAHLDAFLRNLLLLLEELKEVR